MGAEATATQYGMGNQNNAWMIADPGGFFPGNPANPKNKTPPQADYIGAAKEQGAQNIALARVNAALNNPNVFSPLGSRRVTFQGDQPTVTTALSPEAQGMVNPLVPQATTNLSTPLNYANAGQLQDQTQQAILSRLEPQFARDEEAMRTRLANQGITQQSNEVAFNKDMDTFNRAKTDARLQAVLAGLQAAPNVLQQDIAIRDQPLRELQSIISGSTAGLPQFSGTANAQAGNFQGATDAMAKQAMDAFNYQNAIRAQNQQGLVSAGSLAAMAFL